MGQAIVRRHWRTRLSVAAGMAGAAVLLVTSPTAAVAQGSGKLPTLIVILDSSRSMWGQIEGINKVVSARSAISDIAKRHEGRFKLGLIAFGHRQSAGCKDVETVIEPGTYAAADVATTVNGLTPKGSTPIAGALTAAAGAAGGQDATVILIADGVDNCRGDPCAVASSLKQQSPGLTVHVVGFDLGAKEELAPLACIAENTGGSYTPAVNEAELMAAVTKIGDGAIAPPVAVKPAPSPQPARAVTQLQDSTVAVRQPGTATASVEPAPPLPSPAPPAQPEADGSFAKAGKGEMAMAVQPGGLIPLTLAARLTEAGPPVSSGVVWRIYDANPTKDGRYKLVSTHRDATPTAALPAGDYLVNAAYGLSNLTKRIAVQPGKSIDQQFVLNTGGLRLGAVLTNGQTIPPNAVRYDIYEDETDQFGNRDKVLGDAKPGIIVRLNAGAYHIVSVYGDSNAIVRADVAVEPGRLTEATIHHSAAKVTFRLVQQEGSEALADTQWRVLTPGGDVVKESAGALPTHILAAGQYTVLARHNGATYSQDFTIASGEVKQIEIVER